MSLFDQTVVGLLPLLPKPIVKRFSLRYIAGEDLSSALQAIRSLNARGLMATLDVLGEFITRREEAEATCAAYEEALESIENHGLDSNISVKLTALGLLFDSELCHRLMDRLCARAGERRNFVRIDMEDSKCTSATLDLYRRLRERHSNVGIVLQACLRRSLKDIEALESLRPNVRVCKGIYLEPESVGYQDPEEIRNNFAHMVEALLSIGCYVGIATHDERLVEAGFDTVRKLGLPRPAYEFQMLLGVREDLRQSIVNAGHRLRVYVPFGAEWYAYSVRRLKENPRIARYVFRNLIGRVVGNGAR